jgi:hypothetical protein
VSGVSIEAFLLSVPDFAPSLSRFETHGKTESGSWRLSTLATSSPVGSEGLFVQRAETK